MRSYPTLLLLSILCAACSRAPERAGPPVAEKGPTPEKAPPAKAEKVLAPGEKKAPAGEPSARLVELRAVKTAQPGVRSTRRLEIGEDGLCEIDFPTPTGKLVIKYADGKVCCDSNCDGKIDAADGKGVAAGGRAFGGEQTLSVRVTVGGKRIMYPLGVLFARENLVWVSSAMSLVGELDDVKLRLFDTNVNGIFGEVGVDKMSVKGSKERSAALDPFSAPAEDTMPVDRMVAVGAELYDLEIVDGGRALKLSPYAGEKAELSVKPGEGVKSGTLALSRVGGGFTARASSGRKLVVPTGEYRLGEGQLFFEGEGGRRSMAVLSGEGGGKARVVSIRGGANEIAFGPPLKLEVKAYRWGDAGGSLEIEDVSLVGAAGERYGAQLQGGSLKSYVRSGGKEKLLSKLEYG